MNKRLFFAISLAVAALVFRSVYMHTAGSMNQIEYQGAQIKLSKGYEDYEDYKDDPNNIDPSEYARVERLVSAAPIAQKFSDKKELIKAIFDIRFPGYGMASWGFVAQPDGSALGLFEVEIPRTEKSRYFVFQERNGDETLLDDFIDANGLQHVQLHDGALIYTAPNGRTLQRPLVGKP